MPPWTTRLAPSPTGALHLGNARTLVLTWRWARAEGAEVVLRIEDLDHPRKKAGAVEGLRRDLAWLGLDWDRETALQSTRRARHAEALARLVAEGRVYPCVCTRSDVDDAASAPHESGGERAYAGTCRDRFASVAAATAAAGRPVALRFRAEDVDESFEDLVLGPRRINPARVGGDFVVGRADTAASIEPGYQSAVVIDDADDGVTRVLRGADLLTSAARQRQLARALGLPPVAYGHFPLVVGPDGRRLAKRHGDTRLASLAARGVTAAEVRAWIAASAGVPAEEAGRLVPRSFDPSRIPTEPVVPPPAWS